MLPLSFVEGDRFKKRKHKAL